MRVFGLNRQFNYLSRRSEGELSAKQLDRLRALGLWQQSKDVRLVCETFGLSRATLYRWRKRFNPQDLSSLKDLSRRPRKLREPRWPLSVIEALRILRERYPRWGKNKLAWLLHAQGFKVSPSSVGRILTRLRRRGQLIEPKKKAISAKRRHCSRSYAVRKPKDYVVNRPGDLIEVDTLDIRPVPGGHPQTIHGT